jgi:hypothetical protein
MPPPPATIRTQVSVPLRFADGYSTAARVFSFSNNPDKARQRVFSFSNNPDKARQLRRFGVTVTSRMPTGVHLSPTNARYLATKARRGAHTLDVPRSAG